MCGNLHLRRETFGKNVYFHVINLNFLFWSKFWRNSCLFLPSCIQHNLNKYFYVNKSMLNVFGDFFCSTLLCVLHEQSLTFDEWLFCVCFVRKTFALFTWEFSLISIKRNVMKKSFFKGNLWRFFESNFFKWQRNFFLIQGFFKDFFVNFTFFSHKSSLNFLMLFFLRIFLTLFYFK